MDLSHSSGLSNEERSLFLKELTLLFASYAIDKAMAHLDEEVTWHLVGDKPIHGKKAFASALRAMSGNKAISVNIQGAFVSGMQGMVHGEMHMQNGDRFGFADVYTFLDGPEIRVQTITSYVVPL